jgi:hypothetical protein
MATVRRTVENRLNILGSLANCLRSKAFYRDVHFLGAGGNNALQLQGDTNNDI